MLPQELRECDRVGHEPLSPHKVCMAENQDYELPYEKTSIAE